MKTVKVTNQTIKSTIKSLIAEFGNDVDLNHLDVSKVTNMRILFTHSNFNGEILKWNVSNVTDMTAMFYDVKKFNQDISKWDVRNVTKMDWMFYDFNFDQDIIKEYFNSDILKGRIIDVLKDNYPEEFI